MTYNDWFTRPGYNLYQLELVRTTRFLEGMPFWNNLHQVHSKSKDWRKKSKGPKQDS